MVVSLCLPTVLSNHTAFNGVRSRGVKKEDLRAELISSW